jgi:hypothetical protein
MKGGGATVLRLSFSHVRENDRWWQAAWRRLERPRRKKAPGGLGWADGQDELGRRKNFPRKMVWDSNRVWAEMVIGLHS